MTPEIRSYLAELGTELSLPLIQCTQNLFAEKLDGFAPASPVERDIAYGPHERHLLDVFWSGNAVNSDTDEGLKPVLVYVHGGGFVMGDKRSPVGMPFHDNIGHFAAENGMVGVTVNYRLAPESKWPAGPEDMALIVAWLQQNIAQYGGDPAAVFLMGQSAGAVHVASYTAHPRFHVQGAQAGGAGIAGALLISCLFEPGMAEPSSFHTAYYGEDPAVMEEAATLQGLVESPVPVLATVSEFDVANFQKQAARYVAAFAERYGNYPKMAWLWGHNHLSPASEIGCPDASLAPLILAFVAAHRP